VVGHEEQNDLDELGGVSRQASLEPQQCNRITDRRILCVLIRVPITMSINVNTSLIKNGLVVVVVMIEIRTPSMSSEMG